MKFFRIIFLSFFVLIYGSGAQAFWMWTPETNRWVNPKYAVKDTPQQQLKFALEIYNAKDYPKAMNEFEKLIKYYPLAREAAEAQYYIGESQYAMGDLFKAFKSYQRVLEKYPFNERSAEIVKKQFNLGVELMEGKGQKSKFVRTVIGSEYDPIEIFRTVIKNAPYGENAAPAQYKIGLYLMEKQMYQEARDEFEKAMNDYPNTEWARAAKYQIALADAKRSAQPQYDQKVTQVAIEEMKDFVAKHPEADLSKNAKDQISALREKEAENNFVIATFYEKQKKYDAAKTYYNAIINDYKDTSWARKAIEKLQTLGIKK